jgi:Ca2+/Na+ antiporter
VFLAAATHNLGLLLIAASAIGFYVAARVAVDAITNLEHPSATRLALGHWFPIAFTALVAVSVGQPGVAVCIAFGTCVASLLLNLGLITATTGDTVGPADSSRAWPLLIPVGLLAFTAGFRAHLNWIHAVILLIQGIMVMTLWSTQYPKDDGSPSKPDPQPQDRPSNLSPMRWIRLFLALIIAIFAAFVALYGTLRMATEIPLTTPGLIAAVGLSPLLVLPMIGTGTVLAERGQASTAASSLIAVALLNLCLLLPLLIVATIARNFYLKLSDAPSQIPFPIATWRVDAVLILVMGALLAPVSMGRWRLGRTEGVFLVIAYAAYLGATSVLAVRW